MFDRVRKFLSRKKPLPQAPPGQLDRATAALRELVGDGDKRIDALLERLKQHEKKRGAA